MPLLSPRKSATASGSGTGSKPNSSATANAKPPSTSTTSTSAPPPNSSSAATSGSGRPSIGNNHGRMSGTGAVVTVSEDEDEMEVDQLESVAEGKKKAVVADDDEEDPKEIDNEDEDDDEEEDEEEYEVEKILDHGYTKSDGQFWFLIKWVGYPDSDNTWEPEDNIDARELIDAYWTSLPGNKQSDKRAKLAAKLKRDRQGRIEPLSKADLKDREEKRKKMGDEVDGKAKKTSTTTTAARSVSTSTAALPRATEQDQAEDDDDDDAEISDAEFLKLQEKWRAHFDRLENWEDEIRDIITVERPREGQLAVYIHFKSMDARLVVPSSIAHAKCPLRLLQFYESKLRFSKPPAQ